MILRLGFLGHKNVAAPGYLKEALMLREVALKPTWLLMSPSSPFGPGHFTYSDELAEYITEHFDVVDFKSNDDGPLHGVEGTERKPKPTVLDDEESVALGAPSDVEEEQAPVKRPPDVLQSDDEDPMGLNRSGRAKPGSWKKKKSSWKKRGNDDGGSGGMGGLV